MKKISLTVLMLLSQFFVHGSGVDEKLQAIPEQDKQILEGFFTNLILSEYFGYVLFGNKSMAAAGFETEFTPDALDETALKQHQIQLGWQTWEKYSELFPSEKLILRLSKSPLGNSYSWIVLINKETTLKCINANILVFKDLLGNDLNPEGLLQRLCTTGHIFGEALKRQDGLLGMLLGYGKAKTFAPFKYKSFTQQKN